MPFKRGHKLTVTHGMSNTPEYRTWCGIKNRCYNNKVKSYPYYGGRGITVCKRWLTKDGFINFYSDMGDRPSSNYSIDRINNNGNYTQDNCRWATRQEQGQNKRTYKNASKHGTRNKYDRHKCRCTLCVLAYSEYQKNYRKNVKEKRYA